MSRILLLVGMGGFIGSIARYSVQLISTKLFSTSFPIGTFIVNVVGCFLIGVFFALSEKSNWLNAEWRFFLMTGLCGGFTTFSAFSLESIGLLKEAQYLLFVRLYFLKPLVWIGCYFLSNQDVRLIKISLNLFRDYTIGNSNYRFLFHG